MVDAAHLWPRENVVANDARQLNGWQPRKDGSRVSVNATGLPEKPAHESMCAPEFVSDYGSPQGDGIGIVNLAQMLAPSVQVLGVGRV